MIYWGGILAVEVSEIRCLTIVCCSVQVLLIGQMRWRGRIKVLSSHSTLKESEKKSCEVRHSLLGYSD